MEVMLAGLKRKFPQAGWRLLARRTARQVGLIVSESVADTVEVGVVGVRLDMVKLDSATSRLTLAHEIVDELEERPS